MSTFFWTTYVLLWATVVIVVVAVLLLYRQFGLTFMEPRRRIELQGPDVGRPAPAIAAADVRSGERLDYDWNGTNGSSGATLLLFARPGCAVCHEILPEIDGIPGDWPGIRFLWVEPGGTEEELVATKYLRNWRVVCGDGEAVHEDMAIAATPFTVLIGPDGTVQHKALVNSGDEVVGVLEHGLAPPEPTPSRQGGRT